MLTFVSADLTLANLKATEGFVTSANKPTDKYTVSIKEFLTPVLMRLKPYDKTNRKHNLAGAVLASSFYEAIYNK